MRKPILCLHQAMVLVTSAPCLTDVQGVASPRRGPAVRLASPIFGVVLDAGFHTQIFSRVTNHSFNVKQALLNSFPEYHKLGPAPLQLSNMHRYFWSNGRSCVVAFILWNVCVEDSFEACSCATDMNGSHYGASGLRCGGLIPN